MDIFRSPYLLASATVVFWSFGAYLTRLISLRSQFLLIALSFFFTVLVFSLYFTYLARRQGSSLVQTFRWPFVLFGPLGYFLYTVPQVQSFRAFGSASEATILNYTWPFFAVMFTVVFFSQDGPRPSRTARIVEGFSLMLGFLSVLLVATEGQLDEISIANPTGILWGLISGASYGLFSAYSTRVSDSERPAFLMCAIGVSLVLILPLGLAERQLLSDLRSSDVVIALLIGLGLNGIAYITWTSALNRAVKSGIGISRIVAIAFSLPVLSLVVVAVLLREDYLSRPYFLVGVLLIGLSNITVQRSAQVARILEARRLFGKIT